MLLDNKILDNKKLELLFAIAIILIYQMTKLHDQLQKNISFQKDCSSCCMKEIRSNNGYPKVYVMNKRKTEKKKRISYTCYFTKQDKRKNHYQEIHQNHKMKSHLPKDQVEPYKPYCEIQMHQ